VQGVDNIFLAHDGFENKYGFRKPFNQVTATEFSAATFDNKLTTINLDQFFELFRSVGGSVVFDVKNIDDQYVAMISEIYSKARKHEVVDRIVIQAYSKANFVAVNRIGFKRTILAVWKHFFRSPLGSESYRFIEECLSINERIVYGISIPYHNIHLRAPSVELDELLPFFGFWKRIFIHGAPHSSYPHILRRNMGLFADAFNQNIEFRHASGQFNWRRYMFLNPALVANKIDNQVSATCHYIDSGRREGRLVDYKIPNNFDVDGYLAKNRDLRLAGISGLDTAKAHWTLFGAQQSRPY